MRDGRLSWPGWLIHSGQFTHKVEACQPLIGRRARKIRRPDTDILSAEQHSTQLSPQATQFTRGGLDSGLWSLQYM